MDHRFVHFSIAKYLQNHYDCDLYAIVDVNVKPKKFFEKQKIIKFKKTWYFRDCFNETHKSLDINFLKSIEKKYRINLRSISFTERTFYEKFNSYHKFKNNEILKILQQECKFFEDVITEVKPNFLLMFASDWHHMHLFSQICKASNVKVLMLDLAKFGIKMKIEDEEDLVKESNKSITSSNRTFEEMRNYLKKDGRANQVKAIKDKFFTSRRKKLDAFSQIFFSGGNKEYRKTYINFGKTRLNVFRIEIIKALKASYRNSFLNRNCIKNLPENDSFIYYPLHLEPERVLLIDAPYYTNQIEVIRNIAKSLPIRYKLYVKEHPNMKAIGWRPVSFYKQILELPNAKLIHPFVSSEEIVKKCSLVISITGTAGIEALFYKKPSISLSKFWGYSKLPSILRPSQIQELPQTIKAALMKEIDAKELNNYLDWIEEHTFEFDYNSYLIDLWHTFYHGGALVNVDIPISTLESFLKKYEKGLKIVGQCYVKTIQKYNQQR